MEFFKAVPKVTFRLIPLVRVVLEGEPHPRGFPYLPDDDGMVGRLLTWMLAERVYSAVAGGASGGGRYIGYHSAEDAARIAVWLREQGVSEVE